MSRAVDGTVKVFDPDAPTPSVNDIPIVRRFVGDKAYTTTQTDFTDSLSTPQYPKTESTYKKGRSPNLTNVLS